MPNTVATPVRNLVIDLKNFRTVEQADEILAVQAMISIGAEPLWALIGSLADDGYLPTENIIVLETVGATKQLLVKEGNRRVAALKLLHGYLPVAELSIPDYILKIIGEISSGWKADNESVPCAVYSADEATMVDRIVTLTHGKDEKSGRHRWSAVARARHNRNMNKLPENGLDLLEKYLVHGETLSKLEAKLWAGKYPLSILDDALGKLALKFGAKNSRELARMYPAVANKTVLDEILRDIGADVITHTMLRTQKDFFDKYPTSQNCPASTTTSPQQGGSASSTASNSGIAQPQGGGVANGTTQSAGSSATTASATSADVQVAPGKPKDVVAVPINDPRAVKRALKKFAPIGNNRQKVVTLRNEATQLSLADNPIAFCFLLRSMFEISAKAYCDDHSSKGGPSFTKPNGAFNTLEAVLREITKHLTGDNKNLAMVKELHGAMAELGKTESILSVTSLNQLVHNPRFSVVPSEIPVLFGNVFPLLEAMNS